MRDAVSLYEIGSGVDSTQRKDVNLYSCGNCSVVSGGFNNTAMDCYSTIVGGSGNTASGYNSFIGGGFVKYDNKIRINNIWWLL